MKKSFFSIANTVDARNYILFYPNEVKFLRNIKELNIDIVYIGKRVKDLYILSTSTSYIDKIRRNDEVLGELNIFLGLEMMNTKEGIFISQTSYVKKIIVSFGISKSKKISTSLDVNIKLR
ncbi:unnamed protein product [Musa acuminata subsp. burmannicoides]